MKIRNFVVLGLLALAFVLSPVVTNAQTVEDLQKQIAQLTGQIEALQKQIVQLQLQMQMQSLTFQIKIIQLSTPCGQPGAVYNFQTGQLCAGNATTTPTVTPAITVTSPNGGENWQKGSSQVISWFDNLPHSVNDAIVYKVFAQNYPSKYTYKIGEVNGVNGQRNLPWIVGYTSDTNLVGLGSDGKLLAGAYTIIIDEYINGKYIPDSDSSDSYFKIYDSQPPSTNLPPSISGVSGPTTLNVSQSGTWTVTASDPENGSLSYSVVWGDEATAGGSGAVQQTATFTHTYSTAGTFTPTFTVTDNAGQSARTSLSVVVGGGIVNTPPRIHSVSFPGSVIAVGEVVKLQGIATDADSDNLAWTFGWSGNGGGGGAGQPCPSNSPNTTFSTSQSWSIPGIYMISMKVSDCRGGQDSTQFQITVASTTPPTTPTIISSYPPNGAIDARDTSSVSSDFKNVNLILSQTLDNLNSSDFSVSSSNVGSALSVNAKLAPDRIGFPTNQVVAFLSRPLISGERIRLTHKPSNSSVCLGFLPGDVDGNGYSTALDIGGLRSWVGTAVGSSKPLYQTDINRDGVFNEADVTKAGEIYSTAGVPKVLPACPAPISMTTNQTQLANTLSSLQLLLKNLKQSLVR